ncbi:MAG: prlC product [Verrucomicrobiaceae bacterium]|nr:prlC product [Verrucomicrobiaceae bacterium]
MVARTQYRKLNVKKQRRGATTRCRQRPIKLSMAGESKIMAASDVAINPFLRDTELPDFPALQPQAVEAAFTELLANNRRAIEELLDTVTAPTWQNFVEPLEALENRLEKTWAPVGHLNGVTNTPEWRSAYETVLPLLTEYGTQLGQNRRLYDAYLKLKQSATFAELDEARRKVIDNAVRDFRLSGVALEGAAKVRYGELRQKLAELSTRFSNNVLDATQGWFKHITNKSELVGIPDTALQMYQQSAKTRELDGYVLTLDAPAYLPLMQYGENRELRRELYTAYATRASEQGPQAGQWDNSALIDEILALRYELAQLLGFANYAEYSLATKMAESTDAVVEFLEDLAVRTRPLAQTEYRELQDFAARELNLPDLQAWDVPFASEKLRVARYALSQEELRVYFPAHKVLSGLFAVVEKLFAVKFIADTSIATWHPDVQVFNLHRGADVIARCYLDLYARSGKRGGAWMDNCRSRRIDTDGAVQLPVAFLICNFSAPTASTPSLLTHSDVTTLFHEFGHGLHHMLTTINAMSVAGINAVAWDAVELPSQFLENWCWEPSAIPLISSHYQTGAPLPQELLDKMLAAKNFQAGLFMMRQIEFSLFDFKLHRDYNAAQPRPVQEIIEAVRNQIAIYAPPAFNRFQHSFSHIFAGGYAAGYYSYKWAEVLSADAFFAFEEEGIFNRDTGARFLHELLERGGSREPMAMFVAFRGRKPSVDALLRHCGIGAQAA